MNYENLERFNSVFSVDCVIFGFDGKQLKILLIERGEEPFKAFWALPGNLVESDEGLAEAAERILYELTDLKDIYLKQLRTFGKVDRHPQGRIITVAYYALMRIEDFKPNPNSSFAKEARWRNLKEVKELAFDHNEILDCALSHIRQELRFHPIAFEMLPEKFTMSNLQKVYEEINGKPLDKRNFRRKMKKMDLLLELDEKEVGVAHRAAKLFKFKAHID